jgi:hypothetical protein
MDHLYGLTYGAQSRWGNWNLPPIIQLFTNKDLSASKQVDGH